MVAVIAILAALAIPLYANVQARARVAKVQADLRSIASSVATYQARLGTLPADLSQLTTTISDANGAVAGPFLSAVPPAPATWSAYAGGYTVNGNGSFTLTAAGDGTVITVP